MTISGIDYRTIKETTVSGRHIHNGHIEQFFKNNSDSISSEILGLSVERRNIYRINLGKGPVRILIWSQMHGNESTTTKALLDLINTLNTESDLASEILEQTTINILPILNPDGAWFYTRENVNGVDLNRDAQKQSQPEIRILRDTYDDFKPQFCFNLHDQSTIYSVGSSGHPATLSFLAPAADNTIGLTPSRVLSMKLIVAMQQAVEPFLGKQVARYDDSFNLNCVGDTFQSMGTPTILFEAGHFPGDYMREETRKYVWHVMVHALLCISRGEIDEYSVEQYFSIANNEKLIFDILLRNVSYLDPKYQPDQSIGIIFKEILEEQDVAFKPEIESVGILNDRFGHVEYDCRDPKTVKKLKSDPDLKSLLF